MKKKKQSKDIGNEFENVVQKTIASGSLSFQKGDLHYQDKAIECKYTNKKGFRVTLMMLEKLWNQSLDAQKEPYLIIGIRRNEDEMFILNCSLVTEKNNIGGI